MNIAFNINRLALKGLGVTISSLIRNCSNPGELKIWMLCAGLSQKDKQNIVRLLTFEKFKGSFEFIDFDPLEQFGSFRGLHGDWTCYGRLLLADIINDDAVLYLDADLAIELDVLIIKNIEMADHAIAAVGGGKCKFTYGKEFYIDKVGIQPDTEYFNAGVLLLNLKEWRSRKIKEHCLAIGQKYNMQLYSCDQSILNILFVGDFLKLPPTFNCEWVANETKPARTDKMILHFVGAPKPWDPLGLFMHHGYSTWKQYLAPCWRDAYDGYTFSNFKRVWIIRRSYIRILIENIRNTKRAIFH